MHALERPAPASIWLAAVRPRTLLASLTPVGVGSAAAFAEGGGHVLAGAACALAALLLQVAANLANDALDARHGFDTEARRGPVRVTQAGWLPARSVLRAAGACALGAAVPGTVLVWIGGAPVLWIGLACAAGAFAYSGGPWPLASHGLGEVAAFVFFGLVAVAASAWLQSGALSALAVAAAVPVGLLVSCILLVNNLRDLESDARVGKRTLAVRLGARRGRRLYAAAVACAFASCLLLCAYTRSAGTMLPWLAAPWAVGLTRRVARSSAPGELDAALGRTAALHAAFGLLLAAGLLA